MPSGDFQYNNEAISGFLTERVKDLEASEWSGRNLESELLHLKETSRRKGTRVDGARADGSFDEKVFKKKVVRLFRLLPFLYDSDGVPRSGTRVETKERILASTPQEISNAYGDLLKEHLAKQIDQISLTPGFGQIKQWFENTKKEFVGKGASLDSEPSGYIFAVEAEVNGKKLPYILTVNGVTLSKVDVEMAVKMVASDFGVDSVVVPDMDKNPHLVNSTDAREGLKTGTGKKVKINLPEGWSVVDKYTAGNPARDARGNTYTNYYDGSKIGNGYVVSLNPNDKKLSEPIQHSQSPTPRYDFSQDLASVPLLERAILANQALLDEGVDSKGQKQIHETLKVHESEVRAAKPIVVLSAKRPLKAHEFYTAQKDLGFSIKDILARDVATRGATLRALFEEDPTLFEKYRALENERFYEGLASAYQIDNPLLVKKILKDKEIETSKVIEILKHLPDAYLGKIEDISKVISVVPPIRKSAIIENIGQGILDKSVTDQALGKRLIVGLNSANPAEQALFTSLVHQVAASSSSSIAQPLMEILSRQDANRSSFEKARSDWFKDPKVESQKKARLLRVLVTHGNSEGELMKEIPSIQRKEVVQELRKYSNLDTFERLATEKGQPPEVYTVAKRESFEFEPFHIPKEGVKFKMGSPEGEADRYDNESQSEVVLTKSFAMQRTPVTQRQWDLVMGKNPSRFKFSGLGDNPVESISWWSAAEYANRLSVAEGHFSGIKFEGSAEAGTLDTDSGVTPKINFGANGYRLPTEAEWEFAVRGGTRSRFSFGNGGVMESEVKENAWYSENAGGKTHPVAELPPNPNGLFDMHGNVWEWNGDFYGPQPPEGTDPTGPNAGSHRVIRGGSWGSDAQYLRSAVRHRNDPGDRGDNLGVRLVRTPD